MGFDFPLGNYVKLENHVGSAPVQVYECRSDIIIRSAIQQHLYMEQKKFIKSLLEFLDETLSYNTARRIQKLILHWFCDS